MILFILVFGTTVMNFSNLIFASRPTDVMAVFNMTQAQLTAISTVGMLPGALLSIILGNLLDRKGVRKMGALLFFLAALCMVWRVFAHSYTELIIITFLAGVFFLPINVVPPKMLGAWFPREEMATAMGIFGAAAGIGTALAFAIGNYFPSIQNAFVWIAGAYTLMFILWVLFAKDAPVAPGTEAAPIAAPPKGDFGRVIRSKNMWLVMVCGGLSVGAALLLNSYLVNAFLAKGLAPVKASMIATLLNVCLVIGGVLSGIVVSKLGRYNMPYVFICFGGAVLYYLAYMIPISTLTYVLVAVGGIIVSGSIGVNMARIPLLPMTGDFGPESIGTAGGMNNTAVGICAFVVPTIVASIAGDNYTMIFTIMVAILVVIGIVGGFILPELGENGKLAKQLRK
jgi:NNP family nitrate/nitrite transporter-like MFS transporter